MLQSKEFEVLVAKQNIYLVVMGPHVVDHQEVILVPVLSQLELKLRV
jgi:hypothetical protein